MPNPSRAGRAKCFGAVGQTFRLFVDDVNEKEPNDIAYVYSGYAPLSVRLVQAAVSKTGLKPLEETLKLIPGPTFDETQQLPPGLQPKSASPERAPAEPAEPRLIGAPGDPVGARDADRGAESFATGTPSKVTIVFFLGGCTFTEIAALRFMSDQGDSTGGQRRAWRRMCALLTWAAVRHPGGAERT